MSRTPSAAYQLFGLSVLADRPIPGLPTAGTVLSDHDVSVFLGSPPDVLDPSSAAELWYESLTHAELGLPSLRISQLPSGDLLRLEYFDGLRFWLDRAGTRIWATWPANSSIEVAVSYLLGPVFGVLLRLRGITCLHASAVNVRGRGVVFVGPPGAGKSTTAAALAMRGHAVLSDDIAALRESHVGFSLLPAYPHLCLWPDSAAMLFDSSEALPRLADDSEKRRLPLADQSPSFQKEVLPLSLICILGKRESHGGSFLEDVSPQNALLALITNTYAANLPLQSLCAREMILWGRLLSCVPVRKLCPLPGSRALPDLCRLIEQSSLEIPILPAR